LVEASSQTPLAELTALPDPVAAFEDREGRKGKGEGRDEERALPL